MARTSFFILFFVIASCLFADERYSVAGFVDVPAQKEFRQVYYLNSGWELTLNDEPRGKNVSIPHQIMEDVGKQGKVVYAKIIELPKELEGKRVVLYSEGGCRGLQRIKVNGESVFSEEKRTEGPFICDISKQVRFGEQSRLSLELEGNDGEDAEGMGVLNDLYLLVNGHVRISDANEDGIEKGGGIFFETKSYDPKKRTANTLTKVHVANGSSEKRNLIVSAVLTYSGDFNLCGDDARISLESGRDGYVNIELPLTRVKTWNLENPHLYYLIVSVYEDRGRDKPALLQDVRTLKVGVRTLQLDSKGIVLNGKRLPDGLLGVNVEHFFPKIGEAMPNNLLRRDAMKMKQAGVRLVRCKEGVMDASFLDACDELGMLVINRNPWKEPRDMRSLVRRDRNRPSVLLWESSGAGKEEELFDSIVREELGKKAHVASGIVDHQNKKVEWIKEQGLGVSRSWGEYAMMQQAIDYAEMRGFRMLDREIYEDKKTWAGLSLFQGMDKLEGERTTIKGIMDEYRQPKVAWYALRAQTGEGGKNNLFVANENTPLSPTDVAVFADADTVRLAIGDQPEVEQMQERGLPFVFSNIRDRRKQEDFSVSVMEGEKVVTEVRKSTIGEPVKLHLRLDHQNEHIRANGSDMAAVIASVMGVSDVQVDAIGEPMGICRYVFGRIKFTVEGDATIIGGEGNEYESYIVWGTVPLLLRTGTEAGTIRIKAKMVSGGDDAVRGELEFSTVPSSDIVVPESEEHLEVAKDL